MCDTCDRLDRGPAFQDWMAACDFDWLPGEVTAIALIATMAGCPDCPWERPGADPVDTEALLAHMRDAHSELLHGMPVADLMALLVDLFELHLAHDAFITEADARNTVGAALDAHVRADWSTG